MVALGHVPWAVQSLPQPVHLYHAVTGSAHFHLGSGVDSREPLTVWLERLTREVIAPLQSAPRRVLDVGCGLGGTSLRLAQDGHQTLGIDPCRASIQFARGLSDDISGLRFLRATFPQVSGTFDALVAIEVLQHFQGEDVLFDAARRLLVRGGMIALADVFAVPRFPRHRVPYFREPAFLRAASRHGFRCIERDDMTRRAAPSLERIARALTRHQGRLCAQFSSRPDIADDLVELRAQCMVLHRAFHMGDLRVVRMLLQRTCDGPSTPADSTFVRSSPATRSPSARSMTAPSTDTHRGARSSGDGSSATTPVDAPRARSPSTGTTERSSPCTRD